MKLKFYPYDFQYKVEGDKVYMYCFGKDDFGKKICVKHEHLPAFFVDSKDFEKEKFISFLKKINVVDRGNTAKVVAWKEVEMELLGKKSKFWKVTANPITVIQKRNFLAINFLIMARIAVDEHSPPPAVDT